MIRESTFLIIRVPLYLLFSLGFYFISDKVQIRSEFNTFSKFESDA